MGVVVSYFKDESVLKNKVDTDYIKPKIYGNLEGPIYTNLDYNNIYATRHYQSSLWVSTVVTGDFEDAWKNGLPKLKKYMKGANQRKWMLPQTCPIIMKKTSHADKRDEKINSVSPLTEHNKITISMYISTYFTNEPPGPDNPNIFLQEEHKRIFYCGYFCDKYNKKVAKQNIDKLRTCLSDNQENYDDSSTFIAFYDQKVSKLCQQKYFECWIYGEIENDDFKCVKTYNEEQNEREDE